MNLTSRRGLSTMRTHTNRRMQVSQQPHEIYMKLTALEIERSRRATEREAMNHRIKLLDERLADIEAEQAELNSALDRCGDKSGQQSALGMQDPGSEAGRRRY